MNRIKENLVLQYIKEDNKKIRIIWIGERYDICYYVNIFSSTAMPIAENINDLESLLDNNDIVIASDPFEFDGDDSKIPEEHKRNRDKAVEIIDFLWRSDKSQMLYKSSRNNMFKKAAERFGKSEKFIRRTISRFWQRGMVNNALLPDYENRGGKGIRKKVNKVANEKTGELQEIKRGRKRKPDINGEIIKGVNIDDEKYNIIIISIQLFYRKNQTPIKDAYRDMNIKFFSDKYKVNGVTKVIAQPKSKLITYDQFYYWLKRYESKNLRDLFIHRHSQKEFDLKLRAILKNSTMETFGPGSRYQIDATVVGVYLVSIINRNKIVGKPVVYKIFDVYSRLIVGVHVCLEGPSWGAAMVAVNNIIEDKVEFCKKYGIDITPEEWPNTLLPEIIIADNGEFEGYNPDNLINNLDVHVENTPTYRGDMKGIVERNFRTTKERIKHKTPGAIQKEFRERGDKDYRLDATLNLYEFTKIIILNIIYHNNSVISGYPREKGLKADEIPPIPIHIFNWGLKERKCAFKHKEKNTVRRNLYYKGTAIIKREGIKFDKNLFYSCDEAIKEDWYINFIGNTLDIVFDPNDMDQIYIPQNKGNEFIECKLLEKCSAYQGLPMDEITFQKELEDEIVNSYEDNQNQRDIDYILGVKQIVDKAKKDVKKYRHGSDKSRLENIRVNRAQENEIIRYNNKLEQTNNDENSIRREEGKGVIIPINKDYTELYDHIDLLKEVRSEVKND